MEQKHRFEKEMSSHHRLVKILQERGEEIVNYAAPRSMGSSPMIYVKGRKYGETDGPDEFVCGYAFVARDGTITIMWDHMSYVREGFTIDQLGLCDPACWYENGEIKRKRTEAAMTFLREKTAEICTCRDCHKPFVYTGDNDPKCPKCHTKNVESVVAPVVEE